MKKLKEIGKVLNRKEMRTVAGGFHRCEEGYVCGPPCPDPNGPGGITTGWACDSPNGTCRPTPCFYN